MITLKQILVATDFSEPSDAALSYGAEVARSYAATLHVLHVIEDRPALYAPDLGITLVDIERNIEAAVHRDLDSTVATLADHSFTARAVVTRGPSVARAITEYAKTNAIDLIIVGTHGRGAVSRFLMGSVAERVVRTAPCPVLTVHAHQRELIGLHEVDDGQPANAVDATVSNHQ